MKYRIETVYLKCVSALRFTYKGTHPTHWGNQTGGFGLVVRAAVHDMVDEVVRWFTTLRGYHSIDRITQRSGSTTVAKHNALCTVLWHHDRPTMITIIV